jgi:ADP-ribosylglycohydrolase/fructose-1,6-bisphosphatase/inositol monophosphatase family enzyme
VSAASHDYRRALELAIGAARDAGALLRQEFHRPGGPRGPRGKAPADTEAEERIRARLLEAFPRWGYRGEETGAQPPAAGETHWWLVDPNDGTTSFQRGRRGPAVSIAVLSDGRPVLGVVYSYAAPDDDGDLFAWAEGCGPLRRNGAPVNRSPWADALSSRSLVLLSDSAERKPLPNLQAVEPARFRAVASIAYRLALVAAGEAEVAVSLNAPGDWDFAAGHALLRAVGGELLDERGLPVVYPADGRCTTSFCFGGSPAITRELVRRNWRAVLDAPPDPPQEYDLVRLEAGAGIADPGLLARAHGCLLGQLAGDALGSAVEFQSASQIASQYPGGLRALEDGGTWNTIAGQPTDDSELALLLARSIIQSGGYDPEAAARAYHYWYSSNPFDCGTTTGKAFGAITGSDVAAGRAAAAARQAAEAGSQSNGSLMRASPLGIWAALREEQEAIRCAREDSALSHPHPVCRDACAVFVLAIAHAIRSGAAPRAVYARARKWAESSAEMPVRLALHEAALRPPQNYSFEQGWVLIALRNAFYQLLHAPTFEEGVVSSVMAGGDTDTNAAVAGALLGAVYGREAIPASWRQMVLSCRPLRGRRDVHRPRPRAFWPTDALELAERLLVCSRSHAA